MTNYEDFIKISKEYHRARDERANLIIWKLLDGKIMQQSDEYFKVIGEESIKADLREKYYGEYLNESK